MQNRTAPSVPLIAFETPFVVWTEAREPGTGLAVPGQAAHHFYRFEQPVRLDKVILPGGDNSNHASEPGQCGEPRHVRITAYTDRLDAGTVVFDGEAPATGTGRAELALPGVDARAVSLWCDERYPLTAAHGTLVPYVIPRDGFRGATWFGRVLSGPLMGPPWQGPLKRGTLRPMAVPGQEVTMDAYQVRYTSRYLSLGFSLKRPLLRFVSWDPLGENRGKENFIYDRLDKRYYNSSQWCKLPGGNGPYMTALLWDTPPFGWTGTVEVEGNIVRYRDVQVLPEWVVDAEFEVGERGFALRLRQRVTREIEALDAAAWGFGFDGQKLHSIGNVAMPSRGCHRAGLIEPRGSWSIFGNGTLDYEVRSGADRVALQIDSSRRVWGGCSTFGIQLGSRHEADGTVRLLPGETSAELSFEVGCETPVLRSGAALPEGLRRAWSSMFVFRPEDGGFSNTGSGTNCWNCLHFVADMAAYTANRARKTDLLELLRYGLLLAVRGGSGYGGDWEQFSDAAPSLAISAARLQQVRPDPAWLKAQWVFLKRPLTHILDHIGADGLYTNKRVTGNSGTRVWSAIAWDCIGFGHQDGYSNALAYRALCGGAALARDAGDAELSTRCAAAADRLKAAYAPALTHPESGLIAGWRSADGELHDYAFTFINGIAICHGLVDEKQTRHIMATLERMRHELELDDLSLGIPCSLKPIRRCDHSAYTRGEPEREDGFDRFGNYINGSLSLALGYYYLRALSLTGYRQEADRACAELLASFEKRVFEGSGDINGLEFFSHEGVPTGGEGAIAHSYHILLAIAQHLNIVETLKPEWWPK